MLHKIMKHEWCINFTCGRCRLPLNEDTPTLAEKRTEILGKETKIEIITDTFEMVSFLSFYDPDKLKLPLPPQITVQRTLPINNEYYLCTASNCRSVQKRCSHFK